MSLMISRMIKGYRCESAMSLFKMKDHLKLRNLKGTPHPGLTRVRSIQFHLFEIKRVLAYNSTIFTLTDLFILYFFIQSLYADKKVF